jgi:hypothetical protein
MTAFSFTSMPAFSAASIPAQTSFTSPQRVTVLNLVGSSVSILILTRLHRFDAWSAAYAVYYFDQIGSHRGFAAGEPEFLEAQSRKYLDQALDLIVLQ